MYKRNALFGALALATIVGVAGTALATPPSGMVTTLLGRGRYGPGLDVRHQSVELQKDVGSADFATIRADFPAGAASGWHHHPGVLLVTVQSGQLTFYEADCTSHTYTAGQSFVEADNLPGLARNEGTTPTVVFATFIMPSRTASTGLLIDDPQPTGCNVS